MVELLAPAGNFISLRAVLENGADAVYFGLDDYNMRANAKNFSIDDLKDVSKIAGEYGAKTYLCTNVILNEDLANELNGNLETISSSEGYDSYKLYKTSVLSSSFCVDICLKSSAIVSLINLIPLISNSLYNLNV